jgi:S-formylglutathione hydrolase FrmB
MFSLLVFMASPSVSEAQRDQWLRGSSEPIDLPGGARVLFASMKSAALGDRDASYSVFLPPSYSQGDTRYPVVYFLHGLFNDHTSWTMDPHGSIPAMVERLMQDGTLPEMVLVFPDGGRSFYTNQRDGSGDYEDFVVTDLPAFIEATYRVSGRRTSRAIAGTSMGGYGALKIGMRFPDRYVAVAAHSPIVFPVANPLDVPPEARSGRFYEYLSGIFHTVYGDPFDQAYFDTHNPVELAGKGSLDSLAIYFDYGTADRYNRSIGLGKGLQKLDAALTSDGVAHTFVTHEGEPHGWELVYTHLGESLSFIAQAMK